MYTPKTTASLSLTISAFAFLVASSLPLSTPAHAAEPTPKMTMGNGDKNWILTEGVKRDASTLTFEKVHINSDGWLVMHPFENGAPNGDKYIAASFLKEGDNEQVDIKVHKGIETGEMFIVMLHQDSNQNEIFDFVFVDDVNVMDKAVFEGHKMIGHIFRAP